MAVFSSMQKTAACSGGFRYRPMMSAALLSKSGSSLAMYRSRRCGFTPASFQTRCTASLLTPNSAASLRQLQCVEPSFGFLRVDESIRARSFAVRIEAVCPGWLVSSPSMPEARKRCFQRMMVGAGPQTLLNRAERGTLGQHQDQPGTEDISG